MENDVKKGNQGPQADATSTATVAIVARAFSSSAAEEGRFVPGTLLAGRYRIIALLGRGGMGEVYRATDLTLGQSVALKFLPEEAARDQRLLERFHGEVRVARQVSHPNICRVYDIGEAEGAPFISMEYVDGEDLASLLTRIGRLPADKALEIARKICAGLAAAHDRGIVHRDLKPHNIMLNKRGEVIVMDFGLAVIAGQLAAADARSGTPDYMAPEQLKGAEVTTRSDIYALGLVLYELFTGRRVFEAPTLRELIKLRRSDTTPTSPTSIVKGLDPLVEKVIERCLQRKPEDRPASALQVAAALPGGDPLAAALAAGETPSPEMVAAAPTEGALKPVVALSLFAAFVVLLIVSSWATKYGFLYRLAPLNQSPEVLRARARDIITRVGYTDPVFDSADGMIVHREYLNYLAAADKSPNRWDKLRTENSEYRFWYRESPRFLGTSDGDVQPQAPPLDVSGMTSLDLDMDGHLHWFMHVPPQREPTAAPPNSVDWSSVFREAGLDVGQFQRVASTWIPLLAYDERLAWDGADPLHPDQKVHIEAAAFRGKPTYFETIYPWDRPARQELRAENYSDRVFIISVITVFLIALIGSALIARHNLRLGRGDIRGALRLGFFYFIVQLLFWLFEAHHSGSVEDEFELFLTYLAFGTFAGFYLWLLYIALEPFLRRRWPHRIISWSRLLRGDFRDPLVGRDILIGAVSAGVIILGQVLTPAVLKWLGKSFELPINPGDILIGTHFFYRLASQVSAGLFVSLIMFFLLLMLVVIFRREWIALGVLGILTTMFGTLVAGGSPILIPVTALSAFIYIFLLYRYGQLALAASLFFAHLWVFYAITSELRAWYATDFVIGALLCVAIAGFACYTSMAGQSIFSGKLLED